MDEGQMKARWRTDESQMKARWKPNESQMMADGRQMKVRLVP